MLVHRWWMIVCAGFVSLALSTTGFAQEKEAPAVAPMPLEASDYESIKIDPAIYKDRRPSSDTTVLESRTVNVIVRGTMPLAQNEARFDAFFTRYLFPL